MTLPGRAYLCASVAAAAQCESKECRPIVVCAHVLCAQAWLKHRELTWDSTTKKPTPVICFGIKVRGE